MNKIFDRERFEEDLKAISNYAHFDFELYERSTDFLIRNLGISYDGGILRFAVSKECFHLIGPKEVLKGKVLDGKDYHHYSKRYQYQGYVNSQEDIIALLEEAKNYYLSNRKKRG